MRDKNKEQGSLGVLFFLSFEARSVGRYVDGKDGFLKKNKFHLVLSQVLIYTYFAC